MGKTILVVDDSSETTYTIKEGLEELDPEFKVLCADSGHALFKLLKKGKNPDMIILDIMMPKMNGWDVFAKIKQNPNWNNIPIVFLTAKTDDYSKGFGKIVVQKYIEKPFEIQELKATIDTIFDKDIKIKKGKNP